ncbi:MAG TPA: magnesium transporter CorA family protein [Chloroflexota bacterium]
MPDHAPETAVTAENNPDAPAGVQRLIAGGQNYIPTTTDEVVDLEGTVAEHRSDAPFQALVIWLFRAGAPPEQVGLDELETLVSRDENFIWIDLCEYVESDLQEVARVLHLHQPDVVATLAQWQRPRLDVYGKGFFTSVTVARIDSSTYRVQASELDIFVGENYLVSAHKVELPFGTRIMARASHSPELVQHDSAFMLFILLDELLTYNEHLYEQLEDDIERMEERALVDTSDAFLHDLLHLKRYAFALSQLVDQHHSVFAAFLRPDFPFVSEEGVGAYYRDLEGRLTRLTGTLRAAGASVNGAFDIYVSHVTHRTNQIIRVLTIVSTVLLPLTVILGFFGTSFTDVKFLHTTAAFLIMLVLIALALSVTLGLFRRQGWL